jgi:membrane fusion protein, heavy metal efflux system
MTRRKWHSAGLLALAVAAGFLAGRLAVWDRGPDAPERAPREPETAPAAEEVRLNDAAERRMGLKYAESEVRSVRQTIQATGAVGPNEPRLAHIRAMARGRINAAYVRLGDRVKAGQPLVAYDNAELGEAIGEYLAALASIEKAHTEADVANRSLERARSLVELGAVAKGEYDRREAEHRNALASVESQKAGAAKIEERLHRFGMSDAEIGKLNLRSVYHREASNTVVTAPLDGVITQLRAVPGEPVSADDTLVAIADLSKVWVQADVYEKDIAAIRLGATADVTVDAYPDRAFPSEITYVSPYLDPKTRTAKVRCEVDNSEGLLRLDMFATVQIPTATRRTAVTIPVDAVQTVSGQAVAFVALGGGRFGRRALTLGERSEGRVEVLEGLPAGTRVVTEGSFVLKSEALKAELGQHDE